MPAAGREGPWAWGSSSGQASWVWGMGALLLDSRAGPACPSTIGGLQVAVGMFAPGQSAVTAVLPPTLTTAEGRGKQTGGWRVEVGAELRTLTGCCSSTAHLPLGFVQGRGCSYLNSWESNSRPSVLPSGDRGPEDNDAVAWHGAGFRESSCLQGAEEIPRPMGPLPCSSVELAQEEATAPWPRGAARFVMDLPSVFS